MSLYELDASHELAIVILPQNDGGFALTYKQHLPGANAWPPEWLAEKSLHNIGRWN